MADSVGVVVWEVVYAVQEDRGAGGGVVGGVVLADLGGGESGVTHSQEETVLWKWTVGPDPHENISNLKFGRRPIVPDRSNLTSAFDDIADRARYIMRDPTRSFK